MRIGSQNHQMTATRTVNLSGLADRASVLWSMHTGTVNGIKNRFKLIKRTAYGDRDTAAFFLKIRAAFPGVG